MAKEPSAEMKYVVAAFESQAKVMRQAMELHVRRGTSESRHEFERVLPDRLHGVITTPQGRRLEFVTVHDQQFILRPNGWEKLPSMGQREPPFDLSAFLSSHISDLAEVPPPGTPSPERTFRGLISWATRDGLNTGRIDIAVDRSTALPSTVTFDGLCGGKPCEFRQRFRYDPTITVRVPN